MGMSIPVSTLLNVIPGVIGAGGQALGMNGLILTISNRVPIGQVYSFPTAPAVAAFFGAGSTEANLAADYFGSYVGATQTPAALLFVQSTTVAAVPAYVWGAANTLANVQGVTSGSMTLIADGISRTASGINLSAATSMSNAASTLQTDINASLPTATGSSTSGISATTMTIAGAVTGTWAPGMVVTGGATAANTIVLSQLTGTTGGDGTYQVSISQTVSGSALTGTAVPVAVTFDSVTNAFVLTSGINENAAISVSSVAFPTGTGIAKLNLQQSAGAYLSPAQGTVSPTVMMNQVVQTTTNWVSFMTTYTPGALTNFSAWLATQDQEFAYVAWDIDPNASVASNQTCFGYLMQQTPVSGVIPIGGDPAYAAAQGTTLTAILLPIAAAVMGTIAAINFNAKNGRLNFAYRQFEGLSPSVANVQTAANLQANGYNFYGAYATVAQGFQWFQPGMIVGPYLSITRFVNQVWMNASLQLNMATFMSAVNSVPYNSDGYTAIANALLPTIKAAKNFGAIRTGVDLSSAQVQLLLGQAGIDISTPLFNTGWYLQVLDPGAQVRQAGGSPRAKFWYTDGGDVGQINLGSYDVI